MVPPKKPSTARKPSTAKKPATTEKPSAAKKPATTEKPSAAKKPAKPSAPAAKPKAAPLKPPATTDEDDGGKLIRDYIAALAPLTTAQQSAFTRQCSNAKADDWGTRTRAINVLHDGERFARVIHDALDAPRGGLSYRKERFRYFLDLLLDLRGTIETDTDQGRTQSKAQTSATAARERAGLARETLLERLEAYAEGDTVLSSELSRALGSTKNDDALLRSLGALIDLARDWIARTDEESVALAASVNLDEATIDEAAEARGALSEAHGDALGEGPRVTRDTPATNRIEGRVLFEMRYAMRLFEGAHGRDALSPRLVPGPGTRAVLMRSERAQPPAPSEPSGPPAPEAASAVSAALAG